MAFIKKEKNRVKKGPTVPLWQKGEGYAILLYRVHGMVQSAQYIWVYMYKVQLSITGACNSFYTICTLHCTLDMLQGAAGYHRGMQFFLYRVHGMVHNACSRVSQGHAG